jgi:hypothetical protein
MNRNGIQRTKDRVLKRMESRLITNMLRIARKMLRCLDEFLRCLDEFLRCLDEFLRCLAGLLRCLAACEQLPFAIELAGAALSSQK